MSRSGYSDDCDDNLAMGRWIAVRNKAMNGKRGQAFLAEMLATLDAMPVKELIREELIEGYDPYLIALEATPPSYGWREPDLKPFCGVCALGAVGQARGLPIAHLDPHEPEMVAAAFGITETMAREVVYANDEMGRGRREELSGPGVHGRRPAMEVATSTFPRHQRNAGRACASGSLTRSNPRPRDWCCNSTVQPMGRCDD